MEGFTLQAHRAAIVSQQGPFTHLPPRLAIIGRFTGQQSDAYRWGNFHEEIPGDSGPAEGRAGDTSRPICSRLMQPDKDAVQAAAPLQMLVHAAGCCLGDETSRIVFWFDSRGGASRHEGDGAATI